MILTKEEAIDNVLALFTDLSESVPTITTSISENNAFLNVLFGDFGYCICFPDLNKEALEIRVTISDLDSACCVADRNYMVMETDNTSMVTAISHVPWFVNVLISDAISTTKSCPVDYINNDVNSIVALSPKITETLLSTVIAYYCGDIHADKRVVKL